jgi:hypothetical protein
MVHNTHCKWLNHGMEVFPHTKMSPGLDRSRLDRRRGRKHAGRWRLMLDVIALSALAIAGYVGASAWLVPLGAIALSIEASWTRVAQARVQARIAPSSKVITYLVTGVIAALGYSALTYTAGALVWRVLH